MAKGRPEVSEKYGCEAGVTLSHHFASTYKEAAKEYYCGYLDAGLYAEAEMLMGFISLLKAICDLEKLWLRPFLPWTQMAMEIWMINNP